MGLPGAELFAVSVAARPVYTEAEARAWRSVIMGLRGRENTIRIPCCNGLQIATANPTVGSAVQGDGFATLNGIGAGGLKDGMWATFGLVSGKSQLVVIRGDYAAGSRVIEFEPALRGDATTVEVRSPYAEIAMTSDNSGWDDDGGGFVVAFDGEEDF
jgi:hypothetical protein